MSRTILRLVERHREIQTEVHIYTLHFLFGWYTIVFQYTLASTDTLLGKGSVTCYTLHLKQITYNRYNAVFFSRWSTLIFSCLRVSNFPIPFTSRSIAGTSCYNTLSKDKIRWPKGSRDDEKKYAVARSLGRREQSSGLDAGGRMTNGRDGGWYLLG